jgi:hypothetical protein
MATFDNFFIAEGPGPIFAGLQSIPFDQQTAQFRVGVYATGTQAGLQGIALSNPGDTTDVPIFGPAGVYGAAVTSPGLTGWSNQNDGCQGFSFTGTAIRAASFFGPGIDSLSGALTGVRGVVNVQGPPVPNTSNIAGVVGTSDQQHGVIGTSKTSVGVIGFSNNIAVLGFTTAPGGLAGQFIGNIQVTGTKAAVVPFPDGSHRALYCVESPDLWFEDFGTAKLAGGRALVALDPDFARVIKEGDYMVFLTPEGDCRGLYVRRKRAASFEVREQMGGKSNIAFSYRIVGRRKDIKAHRRFAKVDAPLPFRAPPKRAPRKRAPSASALRGFVARLAKETRARTPKGARRSGGRVRALPDRSTRPITRAQLQRQKAKKKRS